MTSFSTSFNLTAAGTIVIVHRPTLPFRDVPFGDGPRFPQPYLALPPEDCLKTAGRSPAL